MLRCCHVVVSQIAKALKARNPEERAKASAQAGSARDLFAAMPTDAAVALHLPVGGVHGIAMTFTGAKAWAARARARAGAKRSE